MAISQKQQKHLNKLVKNRIGKVSPLKGKKRLSFSKEWRANMSKSAKNRKHVCRVIKIENKCKLCDEIVMAYQHELDRGRKKFCNQECRRQWLSINMSGDKHHNWKGGITEEGKKIRNTIEYKDWRRSVFKRDNYTCVECGEKEKVSGKLNADHIKPFCDFPELRLDINNGRTLCIECHMKTDTWGGRIIKLRKNNYEQII